MYYLYAFTEYITVVRGNNNYRLPPELIFTRSCDVEPGLKFGRLNFADAAASF